MQSKIILIGVTNSKLPFTEHFCNYFEKNVAYFSKGVWGSAVSFPNGVRAGLEIDS